MTYKLCPLMSDSHDTRPCAGSMCELWRTAAAHTMSFHSIHQPDEEPDIPEGATRGATIRDMPVAGLSSTSWTKTLREPTGYCGLTKGPAE
jgi:hypothetical protein